MVRILLQIFLIILLFGRSIQAATNHCSSLFSKQFLISYGQEFWDSQLNLNYKKFIYDQEDEYYVSLQNIRPQWIEDNELLISFDRRGHATLYFNGYRIDSEGSPGFEVKSYIRKSRVTNGSAIVVFKNLPDTTILKLKALLDNFQVTHKITCIKLVCSYLEEVDPQTFHYSSYLPTTLFSDLIKLKVEHPENVEFYIYATENPSLFFEKIERKQKSTATIITGVTATGSVISYSFGYIVGEILKFLFSNL